MHAAAPVAEELPGPLSGQRFTLGLAPLPRRDGVRLRPQAPLRIADRCFELGESSIKYMLGIGPENFSVVLLRRVYP